MRHRPCVVQQLFKRKNCVPKWKETQQVRRVPKCELHVRCACINHWAFLLKAMLFQFGLCVFWSCASQLLETLFQQHPTTSKKLRVFSIGMFYFNNLGMFHPNILDMFFIVFLQTTRPKFHGPVSYLGNLQPGKPQHAHSGPHSPPCREPKTSKTIKIPTIQGSQLCTQPAAQETPKINEIGWVKNRLGIF